MMELQRLANGQRRAAREPTPKDWRIRLPTLLVGHLAAETAGATQLDWSPLLTAVFQPMQVEALQALSEAGIASAPSPCFRPASC